MIYNCRNDLVVQHILHSSTIRRVLQKSRRLCEAEYKLREQTLKSATLKHGRSRTPGVQLSWFPSLRSDPPLPHVLPRKTFSRLWCCAPLPSLTIMGFWIFRAGWWVHKLFSWRIMHFSDIRNTINDSSSSQEVCSILLLFRSWTRLIFLSIDHNYDKLTRPRKLSQFSTKNNMVHFASSS